MTQRVPMPMPMFMSMSMPAAVVAAPVVAVAVAVLVCRCARCHAVSAVPTAWRRHSLAPTVAESARIGTGASSGTRCPICRSLLLLLLLLLLSL